MNKGLKIKALKVSVFIYIIISVLIMLTGCNDGETRTPASDSNLLKDIYSSYFPIGAALMPYSLDVFGELLPHFNSITAENDMKWRVLEPERGKFSYSSADKLVAWAKNNEAMIRGHCLLWYKSLPTWLSNLEMTKNEALSLIDSHIKRTMGYFGNDIYSWDVCNEAISNTVSAADVSGGTYMRTGGSEFAASGTVDWYALCGMDFVKQSFRSADEARKEYGLTAELYYNDYGLNDPNKRAACVELVKELQKDGIAIDGVGMQGHYRLPRYSADKQAFLNNFENSIKAFTALGVDVKITELDICVYANANDKQQFDALPFDVEVEQGEMYGKLFEICRKYATPWGDGYGKVTGITTWGVSDRNTPHSNSNHKEFPLIFGTDLKEKKAYYEIISF